MELLPGHLESSLEFKNDCLSLFVALTITDIAAAMGSDSGPKKHCSPFMAALKRQKKTYANVANCAKVPGMRVWIIMWSKGELLIDWLTIYDDT